MNIERERKFITDIDQAKRLTDGIMPNHITQHYLSTIGTDDELRIRRTASDFTDPAYVTTVKQGHGEYRLETEIELLATAYLALSTKSLGTIFKDRHALHLPGLTLDIYRSDSTRSFGVLEFEQTDRSSDIGLFDPRELGIGTMTEVTGLPDFSNRNLATKITRKEHTVPITANLEQIYSHIDDIRQATRPTIITLSGPSCSGKTTILDQFKARYGEHCTTISTDDYYIGKNLMQTKMPEGHATNFDHPAAIDTTRLARDIAALRAGRTITKPLYDMKRSEPIAWDESVMPHDIIIVEGIAANLPEVHEQSDLSLAITTSVEERLRRRMERDTSRKGHTHEQTLNVFMNHVEPSYQTYFAPHDAEVDYVLSDNAINF